MLDSIEYFLRECVDWLLMVSGVGAWMGQLPVNERYAFQFGCLLLVYIFARAPFWYLSYRAYRAAKLRIENIQCAKVVGVELKLAVNFAGVELVGRADEVRQFSNGALVVGDIKTRSDWTVLYDDVYELSLYRYLLKFSRRGTFVSGKGYIRFVNPDTGIEGFKEVSLYNDAWAEEVIKLYAAVRNGTRILHQKADVSQCGKCEFVSGCYGVSVDDDEDWDTEPLVCNTFQSDRSPGWSVGRIGF